MDKRGCSRRIITAYQYCGISLVIPKICVFKGRLEEAKEMAGDVLRCCPEGIIKEEKMSPKESWGGF